MTELVKDTLLVTVPLIVREGIAYLKNKSKTDQEANKISVESTVLTATEQRDKDRFLEEQLSNLEDRYKELQNENNDLRFLLKEHQKVQNELITKLDISQKKTNAALSEITILKIELAAYKK